MAYKMSFKNLNTKCTQLWDEELPVIMKYAKNVPRNGIIVEIGTADGGTTKIINDITINKNILIYTVDIATTHTAIKILIDTPVKIIQNDSLTFSKKWKKEIKEKIDLLIIDGDHLFIGVYNDFYSWCSLLKSKSAILFHDFDPINRQGVAHFGVYVFLETLIENGIINVIDRKFRYLLCSLNRENISSKLPLNYFFKKYFVVALNINKKIKSVFKTSTDDGLSQLINNKKNITSLEACYCLEYLIRINYTNELLKLVNDKKLFLQQLETFKMLEHSNRLFEFPFKIDRINEPTTMKQLSRIIALEQVKLNILKTMLLTFVNWIP